MKRIFKNIIPAAALMLSVGFTSCVDDLDVTPIDPNLTTDIEAGELFNKCYANIAMAGNGGANGDCDIDGLDGGTTGFIRQMFNANELTTDEAICGWGDEGISSFVFNSYDASHPMLRGYYYRLFFGVTICNQYLDEFGGYDATMTAEIRFLRAFHNFMLMDAFGNVPMVTSVSSTKPLQASRAEMYNYIESELLAIEPELSTPATKTSSDANYGRVDKASAWLLLSRLYLNAEVYTGTPQWAKAKEYAQKVMSSPYTLYKTAKSHNGINYSAYAQLFMGDNGENGSSVEALFPILQDGILTTSWGSTLFLMAGSTNGDVQIFDETKGNGTTESWGGNRCRPDLLAKWFPTTDAPNVPAYAMPRMAGDDRCIIDGNGRNLQNNDVSNFLEGFAVCKFNNFKTDGSSGHSSQFPDADFFILRAAEAYLTFAEADARLNGGQTTEAGTKAVNDIRGRANASTRTSSYSLSDICDEWSREFYFEGRRRMDLVRFNRFGGKNNYNWQWKNGTKTGSNFDEYRNIFAIPSSELTVNENLEQNFGY